MKIETHQTGDTKIAEVTSASLIINNAEDGTGLLGNIYYQGFDKVILHAKNLPSTTQNQPHFHAQ